MRCGSGDVEMGTTLVERAGDTLTGARDGLAGTLVTGATRRVGAVVAGTGAAVGVMAVVKICKRLVSARSVLSPTLEKVKSGSVLDSASAGILKERTAMQSSASVMFVTVSAATVERLLVVEVAILAKASSVSC